MSAEENKALFLRFFDDVWAGRPPFDDAWIKEILVAFPDLKATPDRVLAAEDDHVLILFTVTATQLGAYRGIPATGEPISFRGSTTARLEDGQIVEEFPFMEKMGAVMIGQMLGQTAESSWKVGKETRASATENKALIYRYFDEPWNKKNYAVIDELLAPNWDTEPSRPGRSHDDRAGQKAGVMAMHAAFGDLRLTMGELIAEDDQVVVPWELTGIHQGESLGVEPTGKQVTFRGLSLLRIVDGKIVEDEGFGNLLEVLLDKS